MRLAREKKLLVRFMRGPTVSMPARFTSEDARRVMRCASPRALMYDSTYVIEWLTSKKNGAAIAVLMRMRYPGVKFDFQRLDFSGNCWEPCDHDGNPIKKG